MDNAGDVIHIPGDEGCHEVPTRYYLIGRDVKAYVRVEMRLEEGTKRARTRASRFRTLQGLAGGCSLGAAERQHEEQNQCDQEHVDHERLDQNET